MKQWWLLSDGKKEKKVFSSPLGYSSYSDVSMCVEITAAVSLCILTIKKYAGAFEIVKVIFHQHSSTFLPPFSSSRLLILPLLMLPMRFSLNRSREHYFCVLSHCDYFFSMCNNFSMSVIYIYWHHVSAIIMFFPLPYEHIICMLLYFHRIP
jgi:hypothetical protein